MIMDEEELNKILEQIESELNGTPEHDAEVLNKWGEQYRGDPDAEELMEEISMKLVRLIMDEEGDMPLQVFEAIAETADEDYEESCQLIEEKQYEEALSKLLVLSAVARIYPLSEDYVWTDFNSYLDSLVYQDYFAEEIGTREIVRHPMHPGKILYTCGSLLIEMNRAEEAMEVLETLLDLDPVCPKYLCELGEAYKRTGRIRDAYDIAKWALLCASDRAELARCYRDLGYCFSETGAFEDAMMLYMLSLRFQSSRLAEAEITWIQKRAGIKPDQFPYKKIIQRCEELEIPVGLSETVKDNIAFLDMLGGNDQQ